MYKLIHFLHQGICFCSTVPMCGQRSNPSTSPMHCYLPLFNTESPEPDALSIHRGGREHRFKAHEDKTRWSSNLWHENAQTLEWAQCHKHEPLPDICKICQAMNMAPYSQLGMFRLCLMGEFSHRFSVRWEQWKPKFSIICCKNTKINIYILKKIVADFAFYK